MRTWLLACALALVMGAAAGAWAGEGEREGDEFEGEWEGQAVLVYLVVDENTGRVNGRICQAKSRDVTMAVIQGVWLRPGALKVELRYRFESFGIFTIRRYEVPGGIRWQNADGSFWCFASREP